MQHSSIGCDVEQLVVRRLAVRQAPVQISGKFYPLSLLAMDKNHGEWKWMNGMYVLKISK
jgi:hypothetical protein